MNYLKSNWKTLGNKISSAVSLLKGKEEVDPWREITLEELEQHNDVDNHDAWMSVKGIVYDVSGYAAKHPGGIEKIRKYAGKDATDTFNAVHAYVNIQSILGGNRVGILQGHPDAPSRSFLARLADKNILCLGGHDASPTTWFKQDSIVATYVVDFPCESEEKDWTVGVIDRKFLHVFKIIERKKAWLSIYELPEPLINDKVKLDLKHTYKHAEITFRKPIPTTVWANQIHGLKEQGRFVSNHESHTKFDAFIIYKKCLTPNILMFGIQVVNSARVNVPIGLHVNIHIGDTAKPYTPVNLHLIDSNNNEVIPGLDKHWAHPEDAPTILFFMIKIYPKGQLTGALDHIVLDDGKETPTVQISSPYGYFNENFLNDYNMLILIAGGSGITPMIRIIKRCSGFHNEAKGKRVCLIYFCEKIFDLVWRNQFTLLEGTSGWFFYYPVLTSPSTICQWHGLAGRVNPKMMEDIVDSVPVVRKGHRKACICGPPGFNSAIVDSLADIVPMESIYVFSN